MIDDDSVYLNKMMYIFTINETVTSRGFSLSIQTLPFSFILFSKIILVSKQYLMATEGVSSPSSSHINNPRPMINHHFTATLNNAVTVKLDRENYSIWRSQVLPTIIGHNLQGFIYGTRAQLRQFSESFDERGAKIMIRNL